VEGGGSSLEASVGLPSLLGDNTVPRTPPTPPLPEIGIDATEAEQEALMSMVEMGLNDVQVNLEVLRRHGGDVERAIDEMFGA